SVNSAVPAKMREPEALLRQGETSRCCPKLAASRFQLPSVRLPSSELPWLGLDLPILQQARHAEGQALLERTPRSASRFIGAQVVTE
ncbi:hypothetical protein, partial [Streptomyces spinoverrucosus]|uniref:hypothetical protein n=1 Tax=Streptomyces spinoverrucosus TaxID=284043 RepID=UPI001FD4CB8D